MLEKFGWSSDGEQHKLVSGNLDLGQSSREGVVCELRR
jgi:hypothetical protein